MKYIRLFAIAAVMAVVASCMASEPEEMMSNVFGPQQEITIRASYGDPDTRTERASDGSVLWSPGDQISLFYGSGSNGGSKFTAQNTETAKVVNFTGTIGVITGGNDVAMEDTYFWATYPYCAEASCDGASITTVLPSAQVATADTFADDLFPSIGRSSGLTMGFYNICGGLKFTVSEEGIKSVTLQGHNNEVLAGKITVTLDDTGKPVVTGIEDGSDTITVSAPAGESFQVGKSYYLVFVPTVFEIGFTLTFSKGYSRAIYDRTKKTTIRRSSFGGLTSPDIGLEWELLGVPIPDDNFRAYMIQNYDTDGNCVLDFEEAEEVKAIDVNTRNVQSLEGIEYCPNLEYLNCSNYGGDGLLTLLNTSSNPALTTLYCNNNRLTNLDLSRNIALTELHCHCNALTSLDLSNNTSLTVLNCASNKLTTLDLSSNTALTYLECFGNQLTSLDLSSNTALTELYCIQNKLKTLNVSGKTALTRLYCSWNQLETLDVCGNIALTYLNCAGNQLETLDICGNIALTDLDCGRNQLTTLDLSSNTALINLQCGHNKLKSLDVSQINHLRTIACYCNLLRVLDVSNNTELSELWCSSMNDSEGKNLLDYLYIHQGQSIPNVTVDRNADYIPEETIIMIVPEAGGNEGTVDDELD